ncbi:MAG: hypothetical protein WCC59_15255 [Terriglobales bacterium]
MLGIAVVLGTRLNVFRVKRTDDAPATQVLDVLPRSPAAGYAMQQKTFFLQTVPIQLMSL